MEATQPSLDPRILQDFLLNINEINKMLKTVRQNNPGTTSQKDSQIHNDHQNNSIIITNLDSKHKMRHGVQFKDLLDPRDVVLEHTFNIKVDINLQDLQQNGFFKSKMYKNITTQIRQFLVETLSNILSVSFKNLTSSQLELNEVRNYVSSNIVLNVQSIFIKTLQAIHLINDKHKLNLDAEQIKTNLVVTMQIFSRQILINLIDHYPRGHVTGGTVRIKNTLREINRFDDQSNDLIMANDIKISQYIDVQTGQDQLNQEYQKLVLRQSENYADLIMQAVNAAIRVVQKSYNNAKQIPNKQIFEEFVRELFGLAQDQSFKELVQFASPKEKITKQMKELKEQVFKQFEILNDSPAPTIVIQENQKTQRSVSIVQTQQPNLKDNPEEKPAFTSKKPTVINSKLQKILETLKDYEIGIKIPNSVVPFTKAEIAQKRFILKHPSVARVITNWADYLQGIFDNPEDYVSMRLYNYKDIFNTPISIEKNKHKQILINNLKQQAIEVQNKLKLLKNKTVKLLGDIIFKENKSFAQSVFRFSNTRKTSSKINAVFSALTVEYLSILIHHLLKAGQIFEITQQNKRKHINNINLIVFNVKDLLRAKFKCTQGSFITILKSLYILDENEALRNKFKLVSIKNNLDGPANNAVINFLLMGKAVCEIQLSLQSSKPKQRNFYVFSQLVHELIKNKFGVISSCAAMIARYDPTLNSNENTYYEEKKHQDIQELPVKVVQDIYYCQNENCKQLVINDNTKLFKPEERKICLKCKFREEDILLKIDKENLQVQNKLKDQLYDHMIHKRLIRIHSYEHLRQQKDHYKIYAKLEPRGKMELFMVINVKSELRHYMVEITPRVLVYSGRKVINFEQVVDYINISKYIKQKKEINDHFLFEVVEIQATGPVFGFNALNRQKLARFAREFQCFRKQKSIIKSIKYKTEIINCDQDQDKWLRFQEIIQVYAINDMEEKERQIEQKLRFRRYKNLQFVQIKKLQANQCEIKQLFKDMQLKCVNVKEIIMRKNQLRNIYALDNITKLHLLDLSGNKLENVDGLGHLTQVFTLDLSYNQILNVIGLKQLTNINNLDLSCNHQLDDLDGLQNVTIANRMNFYRCFLTNITGLKNLKAINSLDLRHNRLTNLDGLNSITTINSLFLKGNILQNFQGLEQATTINALDLRSNKLVTLQKMMNGLGNISTINNIDLSRNELKDIVDIEFANTIHALDISHNHIDNIVCLKKFSTITQLLVHSNKELRINCLPHSVQTLSANVQQLKNFDFKDCPNLRTLRTDSDNRQDFKNLPRHVRLEKLYAL